MLGLTTSKSIGNLGGTPEMKYLNNSDHVVNFSVAVNERWKNRNGESQERTTWLRIVAFNGIGSACAEHLKKGDGVYVEGRLQIREYEDKDRVERTSVEVVASKVRFLGCWWRRAKGPIWQGQEGPRRHVLMAAVRQQ